MFSRTFNLRHLFVTLLFSLAPFFALAEEATIIANVNVSDAFILEQKENAYTISFVLENLGTEAQFDVRYGLEILRTNGQSQVVVDSMVVKGEGIILTPGDKATKVVEYPLGSLPSGEYEVMVVARTTGGVRLGIAKAGSIYVPQSSGLELQAENCALTVVGDEKIYSLEQGVDIAQNEELNLNCLVVNHGFEVTKFIPQFEVYRRTIFGERVVLKDEDIEPIEIAPAEEKMVIFVLPKGTDPQAYDVMMSLRDALSRKTISNHLVYHYVLQGPSATIQDMALDKGFYKAGEEIILNLFWTKSADAFTGARGSGTAHEGELSALVQVVDAEGQTCAENLSQVLKEEHTEIKVTAKQDCLYPLASVQLVTPNGANLDSRDIAVPKPLPVEENNLTAPSTNQTLIYLTLGALLIAVLVVVLLFFKQRERKPEVEVKKKSTPSDTIKTLALLLLICGSMMVGGREAEAVTFSAGGVNFTVNTNKTTYVAGQSINVTTTADASTCSNSANSYSVSASVGSSNGSTSGDFNDISTRYGSINLTAPSTPGSYTISLSGTHGSTTVSSSVNITVTASAGVPSGSISIAACTLPQGGNKCGTTITWSTQNVSSPTPRICSAGSLCDGWFWRGWYGTGNNGTTGPVPIVFGSGSAYEIRLGDTGPVLNSATGTINSTACPSGYMFNSNGNNSSCRPICPLSPQAGRTIVDFYPGPLLMSFSWGTWSSSSKYATNLPAGTYDITAVAFDGYFDRTNSWEDTTYGQIAEKYYLKLYNGNTLVGNTSSTVDLQDDVEYAFDNRKVNDDLVLTSNVDYIQAFHSAYPNIPPEGANSVYPVCVAFDMIPLPSATGTISGTGCTIAEGASTCQGSVSWSIQNATSPSVRNLTTDVQVSASANGTNTAATLTINSNSLAIRNGTSSIANTPLLALCSSSPTPTEWNGTTCSVPAPAITPPTLDMEVTKNFIRRGGKTNIDFTITSDHDTECTITGVQTIPIVFTHNAATSSAVYAYTTRALNATQKINMTCTANDIDDTVVEGRVNVIPSFEEY